MSFPLALQASIPEGLWTRPLCVLSLKATGIMIVGLLLRAIARRDDNATRGVVAAGTVALVLALPVLELAGPHLEVPIPRPCTAPKKPSAARKRNPLCALAAAVSPRPPPGTSKRLPNRLTRPTTAFSRTMPNSFTVGRL